MVGWVHLALVRVQCQTFAKTVGNLRASYNVGNFSDEVCEYWLFNKGLLPANYYSSSNFYHETSL